MYWINLYNDIIIWYRFAKTAKENAKFLEESANLRVDNIGRIYTVINLPEEVSEGNEYMHEAWVLKNLGPYNKVLQKIGLSGYAVPEISKINEPGTSAYLLVLWPDTPTISFSKVTINIFLVLLIYVLAKFTYNITNQYIDFKDVLEFIKMYL